MPRALRRGQPHRQGRRRSGWRAARAAPGKPGGLPRARAAAAPRCWRRAAASGATSDRPPPRRCAPSLGRKWRGPPQRNVIRIVS
eukprot:scaffold16534_cov55-Phaeocystis_antarctica.AAC.2